MSALYNEEEEKKYLYVKKIKCVNCGNELNDIRVLNSKLRRKESDFDLRPRFDGIDSLKYGVTACPYCGFAAPVKKAGSLTPLQQKRLREKVTSQFLQREAPQGNTIGYGTAVEQYELAVVCAMAMEVPLSEQAYLCLQVSWLVRGWLEEAEAEPGLLTESEKAQLKDKEGRYYKRAYEGLSKAGLQEDFPICGMDQSTYDYLLAVLNVHFKEYDLALKYCSNIVQNRGIAPKLKDKAIQLKREIQEAKKAEEEAQESE